MDVACEPVNPGSRSANSQKVASYHFTYFISDSRVNLMPKDSM
jgi:hypothetical protein